jgi:hypothetical protein
MEESIGRIVKKWVIQEFQFRTMVYGTMDFGFLYCRQGSVACRGGGPCPPSRQLLGAQK